MVVNNFDIEGITAFPGKANSPLLIDTDAVLSLPFALQFLKMVCRRDSQGFKDRRGMKHFQLYRGGPLYRLRQFRGEAA
jgi:hypothetical protein